MTTEPQQEAADKAKNEQEQEQGRPQEVAQDELEALRGEVEQLRAQSLIERADLENQRKRLEREVSNACRFANKQLLNDLLPVLDSIDAALATADAADPLREGLELTLRELSRIAAKHGLVAVSPAPGDAFNPDHHQAMSVIEEQDVAPGAVARTFQKGYLLNDQLLRPAMVAVTPHD